MLDISWTEMFLVLVIAVLAIGPKDIPQILYTLGRMVRRLQYVRFALSQQFDDFMRIHDLEDLRHGVNFEAPRVTPGVDKAAPSLPAADVMSPDMFDEAAADEEYLNPVIAAPDTLTDTSSATARTTSHDRDE